MSKNHGPKAHASVAPSSTDAEAGTSETAGQAETGTAAAEQPTTATDPEPDPEAGKGVDLAETQEAYDQRLKEQAEALEQLRAETPLQTVKIRPEPGQKLLGLVVRDSVTGAYLRTARCEDWRTEQVALRAGEAVHILVLAGEDAELFARIEEALKPKPAQEPAQAVDSAVEG